MKYRTFIVLRNALVAGVVALGAFGLFKGCSSIAADRLSSPAVAAPEAAPEMAHSEVSVTAPVAPEPPGAAPDRQASRPASAGGAAPDRQPLSVVHREVLARAKEPATRGEPAGGSRKWRIKQDRVIIELRSDTGKGSTTWNRAKIDLDRDKNWDEAWDLRPDGKIKRRFAPADDENYTATYDLQGASWVLRKK